MDSVVQNSKGRFYKTADGYLASVTTILKIRHNEGLEQWKCRVGLEEAQRVSTEAVQLGSEVHRLCECYALEEDTLSIDPLATQLFNQYKVWFDANVKEVLAVEKRLYGDEEKGLYAGTPDLICLLKDGSSAIVDIKTSKQCDTLEGGNAGLQLSALQNLYGYSVDRLLIIRVKKKPAELKNPKIKVQVKDYKKAEVENLETFKACLTIYMNCNSKKEIPNVSSTDNS